MRIKKAQIIEDIQTINTLLAKNSLDISIEEIA